MKKLLYIIFFVAGILASAQVNSENRFQQSEQNTSEIQNGTDKNTAALDGPGNPGDPTPIDDYIPLLMVTALGIIAYISYRKKELV